LLPAVLLRDIGCAKLRAHERRTLEAAMPPELRFVKGSPPRMPSLAEAALIAKARAPILTHHGLADYFPDATSVQARFADLLAAKAERSR
jgi:hypothetical protein